MERDKGHDTNRREKRKRGEGEWGKGGRERERERSGIPKAKQLPTLSVRPGAHFHPSKRGKESYRLRYASYPL